VGEIVEKVLRPLVVFQPAGPRKKKEATVVSGFTG
jgi:hypothetical protein